MYKLKKDAFLGVLWKGGDNIFHQVMLLVVKLVLVRLLIPEEFGIVAMAYIVISSLNQLNAFGTGNAFVRDNTSNPRKAKNTLFYLDTVALVLIAVIGFFSAPYVGAFFSSKITDPAIVNSLVWMVRILAISQLIYIPTVVPNQMLVKELRFKESVIAGAAGTFVYAVVAIVLAYMGFGAWSIVIGQTANHLTSRIIVFAYSPFIPLLVFDKGIAKQYLNFGKNRFINSIISIVINNGDDTLIGRLLGSAAIGFYSLGQHFSGLVVSIISGIINGVMFPVFSKIQDHKEVYVKAFFKAFRVTNLFTIPAIGGAVVLAPEIVSLIFGVKWLPIVPVFYVLSISALLNNLIGLASPVLNSLNKPHIIRNNRMMQLSLFVVLIYPFTKFWGIMGTSLVMVGFSVISIIHYLPILSKEIPGFYSFMYMTLKKVLPVTLLMMVVVYLAKKTVIMNLFWLFAMVLLGAAVYLGIMWFIDKELKWDVQEALSVFKEKLKSLNKNNRIK